MIFKIPQNLSDLEHFRTDPRVQFKEETVGDVDVVIPCYMIADSKFWDMPFSRELRGHTYLKSTGELIGVAFHKFFNVGEREETLSYNINWNNITNYTFDKMDGSMINAVVINGNVYFKTKKSFYSDVAQEFTKWFWKQENANVWTDNIIQLAANGISPIFEFYHPDWRIVIPYGDIPCTWWLNSRRMTDGIYLRDLLLKENGFPTMPSAPVKVWDNFQKDMVELHETAKNIEGWIVFDIVKNEFYKVKTKWYLQQHRVQTGLRERDVAELAALEKLDDIKSSVTDAGLDLTKIEQIEKSVSDDISSVRSQVESITETLIANNTSFKEAALSLNGHPYFGLIMQNMRGKEPEYVEYFLKNIMKSKYSLKNVYNSNFAG